MPVPAQKQAANLVDTHSHNGSGGGDAGQYISFEEGIASRPLQHDVVNPVLGGGGFKCATNAKTFPLLAVHSTLGEGLYDLCY